MIKTYQWIKGDNAGRVVTWEGKTEEIEDLGNFYIFTDGSRANDILLNDWIVEVASANVQDLMLLPEGKELPVPAAVATTKPAVMAAPIETLSPIAKLLADSKKVKSAIDVSLVADMPPAELMRILADSYEDGEKQVLDYIANTLDVEDICAQIAKKVWLEAFNYNKKKTRNVRKETSQEATV